ncbi:MAG: PP2C family protein-serine/threonine phosphatase [Vicinamibacterales bacterium]
MIRAVLVDDEPPARVRMRQLLEAAGDVTVVGEAGSALEARAVVRDTRPDLLFLDVEMPEMRGTALAASLPEPRPYIVFATAFESYALEAIAVDATDYLLKPVSRAKLHATLERVRTRLNRQSHLEREVKAASAEQAQMWPGALPAIPGFDCAAASLPARGVGGDFYDAFDIAESRWGLLLGDVSGKGMAAGLVASAVQARVHTAARLARLGPEQLMAAVDRDVYDTTGAARYATAIYATLDTDTRTVVLVNAGHPAVLVLDPEADSVTRIDSTGPALGLLQEGAFSSATLTLKPGAVLVAYTDGVNEARDDEDNEFGEHRLTSLLFTSRQLLAADLCARILDAVRRHRGARQDQDDVTALVVKAT